MIHQFRLAERMGVLVGSSLSRVQRAAVDVLMVEDSRSEMAKRRATLVDGIRFAALSRALDSPDRLQEMFPELAEIEALEARLRSQDGEPVVEDFQRTPDDPEVTEADLDEEENHDDQSVHFRFTMDPKEAYVLSQSPEFRRGLLGVDDDPVAQDEWDDEWGGEWGEVSG